jgi:hypothetical protein
MAFAIIVEIPGGTQEQYERVNEAMGLKGAVESPPGQIIHFAGSTDEAWIVVDVWESREAYGSHLVERGEKAREAVREAGLPPYTHREFEVYNLVK